MSRTPSQLLRDILPHRRFDTYNRIEVSRSAILNNLELFHHLENNPAVIPVLKANAYGHGINIVAPIIAEANLPWVPYIAVDSYGEALQVREVCKYPVLIMGKIKPQNFRRIKYQNFSFVVSDSDSIEKLGKTGRLIKLHLELNTGMNRYGVRPDEVKPLLKVLQKYPNLELEGIMSHLADSDGVDDRTITGAVRLFDKSVSVIEAQMGPVLYKHIAQTAGSVRVNSIHANALRPGIGIFGVNPFLSDNPAYSLLSKLTPVLRFITTVAQVQTISKGEGISYNYTFKAPKAMRIGVIPVGYYEGVPRQLSNTGHVKWGNHYLPIVGRVCMNHTMVDITKLPIEVGQEVEIISSRVSDKTSIQSVAAEHELFSYELLSRLVASTRRIATK